MALGVNARESSQYCEIEPSTTGQRTANAPKGTCCFDGYFDKVIDSCDERIKKNKETIEEKKTLWSWAKNAIKKARDAMHSILSKCGVNSYKKISDPAKQKEYLSHLNDKSSYKMMQIGASSDILHAAFDTGSACSTKMYAINSQAIGELLA